MSSRFFVFTSCLYGGFGVAGLAVASHIGVKASLTTASQMLLFHAPAIIALVLGRNNGLFQRHLSLIALWAMSLGAFLFAFDVALRALWNKGLFAYAAPTGGFLLIGAWALAAIAAFVRIGR